MRKSVFNSIHIRLFILSFGFASLLLALISSTPAALAEGDAGSQPSQGILSLDQAISEGLKNSPTVQRSEAVLDENHWRKNESIGAGFLPKISASAGHYFDVTKYQLESITFDGQLVTLPELFPNNQVSLGATIPIFDGLANVHHSQAASLVEQASEQELAYLKFTLSEQIRLAFYRALAAQGLRNVAVENVKTLEDHLKQVELQRKGGTATQYDTLRISVQLNEAKSDEDDSEDSMLQTHKGLVQLMGLSQDARTLQGVLPIPDSTKVKNLELTEQVPLDRSDLHALEMRADAADQNRKANNSWFIPSVSAGGQFTYYDLLVYDNGTTDNHNYQTAYNVGVFLSWNLFDGGVSYSRAREAAAQKVQAEKASESARILVPYDFAYWKKRYLSSTNHYTSKQLDVTRSEESVRLAKEEERAGSRTSTEVLDAELDLYRSRAGVVNAQVNAADSLINLELALGRNI
jgi:outer membrane protein TolC